MLPQDRERRPHRLDRRMLRQLLHRHLNSLLELRVTTLDDISGRLLDFDIGRDPNILHNKPVFGPDPHIRGGDPSPVKKRRITQYADKTDRKSTRLNSSHRR